MQRKATAGWLRLSLERRLENAKRAGWEREKELDDGELTPDDADAFGRAVAELSLAVAMSRSCWLDAGELPDSKNSKNYDCMHSRKFDRGHG